jgi:hypothetical protein
MPAHSLRKILLCSILLSDATQAIFFGDYTCGMDWMYRGPGIQYHLSA